MRRFGGILVVVGLVTLSSLVHESVAEAQSAGQDPRLASQPMPMPSNMPNAYPALQRPAAPRTTGPAYHSAATYQPGTYGQAPMPVGANPPTIAVGQSQGYPYLDAPMYSSPNPATPIWTGGSYITAPAFAPHEMLYPHTYKAMYPPYYHRVKGGWLWTPFGIRSHEQWELQGTQVQVKYRSSMPLGYIPPHTSNRGPWR